MDSLGAFVRQMSPTMSQIGMIIHGAVNGMRQSIQCLTKLLEHHRNANEEEHISQILSYLYDQCEVRESFGSYGQSELKLKSG